MAKWAYLTPFQREQWFGRLEHLPDDLRSIIDNYKIKPEVLYRHSVTGDLQMVVNLSAEEGLCTIAPGILNGDDKKTVIYTFVNPELLTVAHVYPWPQYRTATPEEYDRYVGRFIRPLPATRSQPAEIRDIAQARERKHNESKVTLKVKWPWIKGIYDRVFTPEGRSRAMMSNDSSSQKES